MRVDGLGHDDQGLLLQDPQDAFTSAPACLWLRTRSPSCPRSGDGLLVHRRGQGRRRLPAAQYAARAACRRPRTASVAVEAYGKFLGMAMIASSSSSSSASRDQDHQDVLPRRRRHAVRTPYARSSRRASSTSAAASSAPRTPCPRRHGALRRGQYGRPEQVHQRPTFPLFLRPAHLQRVGLRQARLRRARVLGPRARSSSLASSSRWWARPSSSRPLLVDDVRRHRRCRFLQVHWRIYDKSATVAEPRLLRL